ncbi:MAG: stage II sporulation protein R, partial [Clostridia bacterium]|nr:stage II sporulation protein R [Clostridia bacterium]
EYFETRTYEHTTLPAGVYLAVRVVLGQGTGKNWWCVMFPPLCLPAVTHDATDGFLEANGDVLEAQDGYEVRFKIVEWYESLRQKIKEFREK